MSRDYYCSNLYCEAKVKLKCSKSHVEVGKFRFPKIINNVVSKSMYILAVYQ